jgi:hypothetical protein
MKKIFSVIFVPLLLLSACSSDNSASNQPSSTEQGATAGQLPEPANTLPEPATTPTTSNTPAPKPNNPPANSSYQAFTPPANSSNTAQQTTTTYPKGKAVPGKKGYVYSPYAEHAGLVDVVGLPPGTIVKCPFTGKNFIVP